jgi:serine/threonine protein phosphatase PrpC
MGLIGALSDIGNFRKINEDFLGYHIDENKEIYIMADGMGGHNAGEVASQTVVESTINFLKDMDNICDPVFTLREAILFANKKVYDLALNSTGLSGMGTTVTAVLKMNKNVYIANVGDSSCFIIKDGGIKKITKDHSLVQELIDEGSITEEEGRKHPNKNIITRAVGTSERLLVDVFELLNEKIEKIILCTDGLSNEVSAEEMLNLIKIKDNVTASEELVNLAKLRGGRDNISLMIFEGVD